MPDITFIGTLPPPHNGMTVVTQRLLQALEQQTPVRKLVISHPRFSHGPWWKLFKLPLTLLAWWRLRRLPPGQDPVLYMVANAGGGLFYNRLITTTARRLGYRIVLHHHVYAYLHQVDPRMTRLSQLLTAQDTHVFLCPAMAQRYRELYPNPARARVLPNFFMQSDDEPAPGETHPAELTLGHLANLTLEKGLDTVLEVLDQARAEGLPLRLILAGPLRGREVEQRVRAAQQRHGTALTYLGPVYGADKEAFFRQLDGMLFPTRYLNEAQPLVILEALRAGVPVLTIQRGCIGELVGEDGGQTIARDAPFVPQAMETLRVWRANPEILKHAKQRARERGQNLCANSAADVEAFLAWFRH